MHTVLALEQLVSFFFKYKFIYFNWRLITILYWFCHTSTWIRHRYTRAPHPERPSYLPPRTIPLGHPSAPAPSNQYHASNLDWRFVSYMILYMFQCHSPKSSYPLPLPQSPKDCSVQHHSLSEKCKSKPQWGTISHQSEWLQSKSLQAINAGEGVEKREPSYTVGGNAN